MYLKNYEWKKKLMQKNDQIKTKQKYNDSIFIYLI